MSELRLGPQDAGRTVQMRPGDRLAIALPETAGTGYVWSVEELPSGARLVDERYERAEHAPIGTASTHVLMLESPAGGSLRLRLARPWYGEGAGEGDVLERFALTVVVRDA